MGRRLVWRSACIALVFLALAWLVFPLVFAPEPTGKVRVPAEAALERLPAHAPAPPAGSVASDAPAVTLPTDPNDLYMLVRNEAQDPIWAVQAESALLDSMRSVPKVGNGARLEVRCGKTTCEVRGVAAPGETPEILKLSWIALRHLIEGDELARKGFASVTSQLGTARSENEFVLYFRRID